MNYQVCYRLKNDKGGVWFARFYEFKVDAVEDYKEKKASKIIGEVKLLSIGGNK